MKKLIGLSVALALLLAMPATGAPSPLTLAKRALSQAKGARSQARAARNIAVSARTMAVTAQSTAEAGTRIVVLNSGDVSAPPGDFAQFQVDCPAGYVTTGHGAGYGALEPVFEGPSGTGYIASMYNPSLTTAYDGNLYVICARGAPAAGAASTRFSTTTVKRLQAEAETEYLRARQTP